MKMQVTIIDSYRIAGKFEILVVWRIGVRVASLNSRNVFVAAHACLYLHVRYVCA